MGSIVAIEHISLDGVYQAPARADEDTRGGFTQGGWTAAGNDPAMQAAIGARMSRGWALLTGRVTYEDLRGAWQTPRQPNPFSDALNGVTKYVASTTLTEPLAWENSVLLRGDVGDAVARLKHASAETLVIFGSGVLVRSLMSRALVDELLLMIHPVILGDGMRLFDSEAARAALELSESSTTGTGVIIASYRPKPAR